MSTSFDLYDYIISIDIGTTFSGSCFSYIKDTKSIVHVIRWPEQKPGDTFEKTPTACLYSTSDHTLLKWGKSAVDYITANPNDRTVLFIDQFKLKLHTVFQHRRANIPLTLEERQYWNAAVDYLREIYKYTCHQLIQTVSPQTASENDFRFVLTVPATWVEDDNICMRLIAIEAGLITGSDPNERLVIINEAFAASLFCEREFCIKTEGSTKKLVKGQRYLVCDAGGGTVDLATYECTDTGVEQKGHCQLALESGGCCGSTILDQNMEKYLREEVFLGGVSDTTLKNLVDQFIKEIKHYFGDESGRNNYIAPTSTPVKEAETINEATTLKTTEDTVMQDIQENDYNYEEDYLNHSDSEQEEVEQDESCYDEDDVFMDNDIFSDDELIQDLTPNDYVYFTLPAHDENFIPPVIESLHTTGNIIRHAEITQLRIKNADISKFVFDPVVENVMSLIRKQIRKSHTTIETLFLLGGFGQSPYLYKKLHYEFITCTNAIQHLIVPEDGYRASMRGGIYRGIDCIDIIPKHFTDIYTDTGERITTEYDSLIGIEIDLFDLTATYSILKLKKASFLSPSSTFKKLIQTKTGSSDFFRKFQFDSDSFLQYNFTFIVEAAYENLSTLTDVFDDTRPLLLWSTYGDSLYYDCLVKSFIHQLYEWIQNDFESLYPKEQWKSDIVRYCISIASEPTTNPEKPNLNILSEIPMSTLKQNLLQKITGVDQVFKPEDIPKIHNNICQLLDYKANLIAKGDTELLKSHVFNSASEIGMVKEARTNLGTIVWIDTFKKPRVSYPYFDITCEDSQDKQTNVNGSSKRSLPHQTKENEKLRILTLDLKLFSAEIPEGELDNVGPLVPTAGPTIAWVFQCLSPSEVSKKIDEGNYKVEDLLSHLAGLIDFMGPHVRDYIRRRVNEHVPFAVHTLGDIFLIPGTDQLMFMQLPKYSAVNESGLLYAIQRFKHCKITSRQIFEDLIKPWLKYRLVHMIKEAADSYISESSRTPCWFFTGDTILFDNRTGKKSFYNILEIHLENIFDRNIHLSFGSNVDETRLAACLSHGACAKVLQSLTRVTEKMYAVHILSYDVKRQENMAQHMYSRLVKKIKGKDDDKKNKKKIKEDEKESEYDEVLYTAQEGALTLLHPLIDCNVPTSSIIRMHNPFLQFKAPHECSIAIVLYACDKQESFNNSISNSNFKKLHRFIFPIKDVTKPIEISCKVEKYEFVFTVKQEDYQADYRCIDYLELHYT